MHDPTVSYEEFHARAIHEDTDAEAPGRGVDGRLALAAGGVDGRTPVDVHEGAAEDAPAATWRPPPGARHISTTDVGGRGGGVPCQLAVQVIGQ